MPKRLLAIFAILSGCLSLASTGSAQSALGEVKACTWIQEDAERLACFDTAAKKLSNSAVSEPRQNARGTAARERSDALALPPQETPAASPPARRTRQAAGRAAAPPPQDRFGLPEQEQAAESEEQDDSREMTIARAETTSTGKLLLTMDNGQLWMQSDTQSLPPIESGMAAVVREGFIGGYRLSVEGRTFRVKRVDRGQQTQSSADPAEERPRPSAQEVASRSTASPPPQDRFGLPEQEQAAESEEQDDSREMTIARAETTTTGKLLLTMDNGQLWMQTDTQSLPPIESGMAAVVREGFIGGYRLSVQGRTFRVKRVE